MQEDHKLNAVVKHILRELDRQSHALNEMQDLIRNQSTLLRECRTHEYQEASREKERLLEFIKGHHETLLKFKENWRNLADHLSVEVLESIQTKIDEIAVTAEGILSIERENYLTIRDR